ncbi:ATP-binding cassette domain-containing protein [Kocuria sp. KH4]
MTSTPLHLRLDGVGFGFPGRRVLTDVSLTVPAGARIGLIGENGAGKTTLLHLAAGLLVPTTGTVHRPEGTGLLRQQLDLPARATVGEVVEGAVADVRALEHRLAALAAGIARAPDDPATADAYDTVLRDAERQGLWALDARIEAVLGGLGLGGLPRDRRIAEVSGGQRRRLALAALLLSRPAALLLDEPTNHLDDAAVDFLVAELAARRAPVLMASHDRWFLDAAATGVVDLDPALGPDESAGGPARQGTVSGGGYSAHLDRREAARRRWGERFAAQQEERQRLQQVVDVSGREIFHTTAPKSEGRITRKFYSDRAAKTVGGRVRAARQRLDALERTVVGAPPAPLRFAGIPGAADDDAGGPLLRLHGAAVSGRLAPTDLVLHAGDRLLVEGPNGTGKSTLLSLLAGELRPDAGRVERRGGAVVGRLAQEDDWPDLAVAAGAAYRARLRDADRAPTLRELGLLRDEDAARPLGELSPGQRRRVALAVLVAEPAPLLLLDEPTNHLSLALAGELEQALEDFAGTVVLATHDRWIRRRWTGRVLSVPPAGAGATPPRRRTALEGIRKLA